MCKSVDHPLACDNEAGFKGACESCPFNDSFTDAASQAQNYGCLPTGYDIIEIKRKTGQNWACHGDEGRVCAGLCHQAASQALDLSTGNLVRYSSWYHAGEREAVEEARTGFLVLPLTGGQFDKAVTGFVRADGAIEPATLRVPDPELHASLPGAGDAGRLIWAACAAAELDPATGASVRTVVGLLQAQPVSDRPGHLEVTFIRVATPHLRKGLGRRMVTGLAEHLERTGQSLQRQASDVEGAALQRCLDQVLGVPALD